MAGQGEMNMTGFIATSCIVLPHNQHMPMKSPRNTSPKSIKCSTPSCATCTHLHLATVRLHHPVCHLHTGAGVPQTHGLIL